ncbi:nickel-responsive transcriptional regulator NikR [Candidatus Bipolaricaulota bacterium]|nr:nickel-responsive transcriptional regulator NikR [Candidatus Bipolaricaulota bacterium]
MSKTVRFSISIESDLIDAFDALSHEMGYSNRSEAIRDAIRHRMVQQEWESGHEVAGVITLLYDHHRAGLAEALMEIQHHALTEVISTTHVHVDADNCLEFVAVRGEAHAIEHLASRMISLKGVKHGALTGTSTGKRLT